MFSLSIPSYRLLIHWTSPTRRVVLLTTDIPSLFGLSINRVKQLPEFSSPRIRFLSVPVSKQIPPSFLLP